LKELNQMTNKALGKTGRKVVNANDEYSSRDLTTATQKMVRTRTVPKNPYILLF